MRNYTRWVETSGPDTPPGTMLPLEADILGAAYHLMADTVSGNVYLAVPPGRDPRLVLSPDEARMLGVRLIEGAALADGNRDEESDHAEHRGEHCPPVHVGEIDGSPMNFLPQPQSTPAGRIARERDQARQIIEGLANGCPDCGTAQFSVEVCYPDHDEPEGTPPELLAYIDGHRYVLTIEPDEGWEVLP